MPGGSLDEESVVGLGHAELALHGFGRQPDLVADDAAPRPGPFRELERLDRIGVVDRHVRIARAQRATADVVAYAVSSASAAARCSSAVSRRDPGGEVSSAMVTRCSP